MKIKIEGCSIMVKIEDIELLIRDLIRINETIVTDYDAELLCSDYEKTKNRLKKLYDKKIELVKELEKAMDEFFEIPQNFITKKLKVNSFKLIPKIVNFEYKFNLPKSVDATSRQYFCYTFMMEKLTREFDVITRHNDGYYILDISETLNLKKLLKGELNGTY